MESSLEDYYAILGLDPGASQESIKLAYRRLAREMHPDRNLDSPAGEQSALSLRMAQLNGAYAVLSNPALRREYDEKMRIVGVLTSSTVSSRSTATVTLTKSVITTQTPTRTHSGIGVPSSPEADANLMRELSNKVRLNLLSNPNGFTWSEIALEGFDWGLEYASWRTHYCVGGRGFGLLDPPAARKFASHSEIVISQFNRSVRKSQFLFILPFQRMSQWDSVSAELNRIFTLDGGQKRFEIPVSIVLFDSHKGRKLRVGSDLKERCFEEALLGLSAEHVNSQPSVSH
jgi:curved DNA-binding protein CbpA